MADKKSPLSAVIVICSICLVASLLLTLTYQASEENVRANSLKQEQALMTELLPEGDSFSQVGMNLMEGVSGVWKADNGAGWIVASSANGHQGEISVMTGISASGKISGVRVTDIGGENPGIAGRLSKGSYLEQYKGASGITSLAPRSGLRYIEAVSGATQSSAAVFSCVSLALMQIQEMESGDIE